MLTVVPAVTGRDARAGKRPCARSPPSSTCGRSWKPHGFTPSCATIVGRAKLFAARPPEPASALRMGARERRACCSRRPRRRRVMRALPSVVTLVAVWSRSGVAPWAHAVRLLSPALVAASRAVLTRAERRVPPSLRCVLGVAGRFPKLRAHAAQHRAAVARRRALAWAHGAARHGRAPALGNHGRVRAHPRLGRSSL